MLSETEQVAAPLGNSFDATSLPKWRSAAVVLRFAAVDHASIAPDFPQGAFSDYLSVPRAFTTARRAGYFP